MIEINKLNLSKANKEILDNYQTYLISVKFLKIETTINSYILDVYKYLEYINKDYNKTNNDDIYKYLKHIENNDYSIYSIVRKISSLKSFYNYLNEENIYIIELDIEKPKFYKKLPHILSIADIDKLLEFKLETPFD